MCNGNCHTPTRVGVAESTASTCHLKFSRSAPQQAGNWRGPHLQCGALRRERRRRVDTLSLKRRHSRVEARRLALEALAVLRRGSRARTRARLQLPRQLRQVRPQQLAVALDDGGLLLAVRERQLALRAPVDTRPDLTPGSSQSLRKAIVGHT